MTWTGPDYTDNGTCDACGKHVNLDAEPPCPHGIATCDMCDATASCAECKSEEEAGDLLPPLPPYCPIHRRRSCTCGYGDRA